MPGDFIEIDASQAHTERDITRLMRQAMRAKPTPFQIAQRTVQGALDQWWKDMGYKEQTDAA